MLRGLKNARKYLMCKWIGEYRAITLTEGVDNIQGTAGNDTIIAGEGSAGGVHTLGASDVINGGGGIDTIDIKLVGHQLTPRMSNVEKVFAQALDTAVPGTDAINMVNATGVQELWSNNSTNDLAVTNLQEKATIGVKGGNGSNYTVQAAAAALTGDLAIALDGANVGSLIVNSTGAAGGAGYTSTTINAATGTNRIGTLDVGNALATVKVTGDGSVRVTAPLAATVRTIDASANKGGVDFNITTNTGNVTFTGGEGNDRIDFGGTLNLNDKVDGGAGRDILAVTDDASIISGLQVSKVEILELSSLADTDGAGPDDATVDASLIAGVDEVRVTTTLTNGIVNGLTSNSTFVTNAAGTATLNLTNAQVAGTQDTLNLKTGVAGIATVNISAPGVETVAYTQNNVANAGANTTVNFFDADGVVDMTTLTIANNAGNTVNFDGLVNTIKTVNASAAKGAVNVSVAAGNPTNGVSITGGAGNDTLIGGDGRDVIVGGAGNDNISGDIFIRIPGTGGPAVAQVSTITLDGTPEPGDTFSVLVNGNIYTASTAAALAAAIAAGEGAAIGGTSFAGNVVTVTGLPDGTPFTIAAIGATNQPAVPAEAEVSTVTIDDTTPYDTGDVVRVTINSINFDYTATAGDTAANIAAALAAAINAAGQMTATVVDTVGTDSVITLTGTNVATDYTVAASLVTDVSADVAATPEQWDLDIGTETTAPGDAISVTINGTTVLVTNLSGTEATDAQTLVNAINAAGISNIAATLTGAVVSIVDATGADITISASKNGTAITTNLSEITQGILAVDNHVNVAPVAVDNSPTPAIPAGVDDQTVTVATTTLPQASTDQYIAGAAAADILTGGEGNDTFWLLSGSNGFDGTNFTTMDTITDLNLGGATAVLGVDRIVLNSAVFNPFGPTDLINAGTPLAMTGPNLAAAVQALFNAGGALNGSLNDVGLFTYGSDTYLIATDNVLGLNGNDLIVKVTGVTGTLDLSDIVLA